MPFTVRQVQQTKDEPGQRFQPGQPSVLQPGIVVVAEIVDAENVMSARNKPLADVHADKAGAAGDKNPQDLSLRAVFADGTVSALAIQDQYSGGMLKRQWQPNSETAQTATRSFTVFCLPFHAARRCHQRAARWSIASGAGLHRTLWANIFSRFGPVEQVSAQQSLVTALRREF